MLQSKITSAELERGSAAADGHGRAPWELNRRLRLQVEVEINKMGRAALKDGCSHCWFVMTWVHFVCHQDAMQFN